MDAQRSLTSCSITDTQDKTRLRLRAKQTLTLLTLLVLFITLVNVSSADAMGPIFLPTSFEEFVSNSTLIIIGRVQSTSVSKETEGFRFTRRTSVEALKVLKGDATVKSVVIYHEVIYPTVEVSLTKGQTYLLFLYRRHNEAFFRYLSPPFWASWEVIDDQLVNRKPWGQEVIQVPTTSFLAAIASEMRRRAKPIPKAFAGIDVGTTLEQATSSSGFTFARYNPTNESDANWARYYALPRDRQEHLVALDLYRGRVMHLNVYFPRKCRDCPETLLRNLELKYGGLALGQFGALSFDLGRMWSDDKTEVRLGSLAFVKANGYPWGEFNAYEVSITDKHVLSEYLSDNLKKARKN